MYDRKCPSCGAELIDCWEPLTPPEILCVCGQPTQRAWLHNQVSGVISDECDVWVKNGICNFDGTPRHYRFKSEMRAEAKRRGVVNHVEHVGLPGSDKSPHTSKWY